MLVLKRIALAARAYTPSRYFRGSKYVGAGALIFDPGGRVLMIKNRLRNSWEYPAGGANGPESPLETCMREVSEEVGLVINDYHLIAVDYWQQLTPNGNLLFTFGAQIPWEQAAQVKPQVKEVSEYRWVSRSEAVDLVPARLRARLAELFAAYDSGKPVYLHTGMPVI
jgi:8-oxo-dGTP diphosphatase